MVAAMRVANFGNRNPRSCPHTENSRSSSHPRQQPCRTSISQMVQVVSMLLVPKCLGSASHQSKEVRGAQKSLCLFCKTIDRCEVCMKCSGSALHQPKRNKGAQKLVFTCPARQVVWRIMCRIRVALESYSANASEADPAADAGHWTGATKLR
eukprot:1146656-Pelagomonas_calceolata.AAC.3